MRSPWVRGASNIVDTQQPRAEPVPIDSFDLCEVFALIQMHAFPSFVKKIDGGVGCVGGGNCGGQSGGTSGALACIKRIWIQHDPATRSSCPDLGMGSR
jgi:hypothetical protein